MCTTMNPSIDISLLSSPLINTKTNVGVLLIGPSSVIIAFNLFHFTKNGDMIIYYTLKQE